MRKPSVPPRMRKPLMASAVLHVLVIGFAYFGLPATRNEVVVGPDPVAVDVVTVGETTNLPTAAVTPKPEAKPEPKPKAKPPAADVAKAEPSPKPKPEVQARVDPKPKQEPKQAPKQEPKSEPKPKDRPAAVSDSDRVAMPSPQVQPDKVNTEKANAGRDPEPMIAPAKTDKPPPPAEPKKVEVAAVEKKDEAKSDPKPAPESKSKPAASTTDFKSVLKTVEDLNTRAGADGETPAKAKQEAPAAASSSGAGPANDEGQEQAFESLINEAIASASDGSFDPSQPMTVSEIDLVRRQIERCWNIPAGARDAGDLVVRVRVEMNSDGTPRMAAIVNDEKMRGDSFYRAAAESALRAVLNPRCHPFKLPPEKFQRWKTMTLVFNPKDMLGT